MSDPEIADQQYTLRYYLKRSKRKTLPLAHGFLQSRGEGNKPGPGPLKEFIRRGRETALDQYLIFHAIASGEQEEGFDVRLPASTWARATGGYINPKTGKVEDAALHAVSRNWKFLRDLGLVRTRREGRRVKAFLLADDGSGKPYKHVGDGKKGKKLNGPGYLQLPYEYWHEDWHNRLSLAGKAMLLISLYQGNGFPLPYEKVPHYYGISASSAQRGLSELIDKGLLYNEQHRRAEPESPYGFANVYYYELLPPFGPRGRKSEAAPAKWRGPAAIGVRGKKEPKKRKAPAAKQRPKEGRA